MLPGLPLRITVIFPDGERDSQEFTLHRHTSVNQFKMALASLMGTTSPLSVTVGPDWEELDHHGPVSARVLPGSAISCPYLVQGSQVRVRRLSPAIQGDDMEGLQSGGPRLARPPKRLRGPDHGGSDRTPLEGEDLSHLTSYFNPSGRSPGREVPTRGLPSQPDELVLGGVLRVTPAEMRKLRTDFRTEAKLARSAFKASLVQEWHIAYPSMGDKENSGSTDAGDYENDEYAFDHFVSERMQSHDRWAAEKKATFLASLIPQPTPTLDP